MSPGRLALLRAAREVFGERGYRGASIREIARRAEVSEALVYRHFDTKEHLFEESLLGPIRDFVTRFIEDWRDEQIVGGQPLAETIRAFSAGLYDLMREHRALLQAHFAAHTFDRGPVPEEGAVMFAGFLDSLANLALEELEQGGLHADARERLAVAALSRAVVACITGFALMDQWLFDADDPVAINRDGVLDCVTAMVVGRVQLLGATGESKLSS
jgi:AcrR family transcriptional regulator